MVGLMMCLFGTHVHFEFLSRRFQDLYNSEASTSYTTCFPFRVTLYVYLHRIFYSITMPPKTSTAQSSTADEALSPTRLLW
jgi:hypothetical protein